VFHVAIIRTDKR